jgi:hypothetical protein
MSAEEIRRIMTLLENDSQDLKTLSNEKGADISGQYTAELKEIMTQLGWNNRMISPQLGWYVDVKVFAGSIAMGFKYYRDNVRPVLMPDNMTFLVRNKQQRYKQEFAYARLALKDKINAVATSFQLTDAMHPDGRNVADLTPYPETPEYERNLVLFFYCAAPKENNR